MMKTSPEELATIDWEQDAQIAWKASRLIDVLDELYKAADYRLAYDFWDIVAPLIDKELSKTDCLSTYVLDDFIPKRSGIIRIQTTTERLDEIRKDVEQKLCAD